MHIRYIISYNIISYHSMSYGIYHTLIYIGFQTGSGHILVGVIVYRRATNPLHVAIVWLCGCCHMLPYVVTSWHIMLLCVCVYVYIYIYVYIHIHIYIYIYICIERDRHTYIHIQLSHDLLPSSALRTCVCDTITMISITILSITMISISITITIISYYIHVILYIYIYIYMCVQNCSKSPTCRHSSL